MKLLNKSSRRFLLRYRWQTLTSIVGVALGVAVVVGIDLANSSAARAFEMSTNAVIGSTTHSVLGGPTGIDESLVSELRVERGLRTATPVVEGVASAIRDGSATTMRVLGVDPIGEEPFRGFLEPIGISAGATFTDIVTTPGAAVMTEETAQEIDVELDGTFSLTINGEPQNFTLVALLEPQSESTAQSLSRLIVTDISSAQEAFQTEGRITRIDLIVDEQQAEVIADSLPQGLYLEPAAAGSRATQGMTRAFRMNLQALSGLALVVGMFLVYNTMTFSVLRRREQIGTWRALGVTRNEVMRVVLREAFVIGVVGTLLGVVFGIVLGSGLVRLVSRTINDLYYVLNVTRVFVGSETLAKAALLGLASSLLSAARPAWEAARVQPRGAQLRSQLESTSRRRAWIVAALGVVLVAMGAGILALPSRALPLAYVGMLLLLLGFSLGVPLATIAVARVLIGPARAAMGLVGAMGVRSVEAALSRTGVAIAALAVAISVTVAVSVMVSSFRTTVIAWLDQVLQSDVYVSSTTGQVNTATATLDPRIVSVLAGIDGVESTRTVRSVMVTTQEFGTIRLVALGSSRAGLPTYRFQDGEYDQIVEEYFERGGMLISEPLAYRHELERGDTITLISETGDREFAVAGVFKDYAAETGAATIHRKFYDQLWNDPAVSGVSLELREGTDTDEVLETVRTEVIGAGFDESMMMIESSAGLMKISIDIFDRTFTVTSVLRLLAIVISFIAVLSALLALALDRAREIGVLRATGLTRVELWKLVLCQTATIGVVAGLLATPLGVMLAAVMVYVINKRSFGWTVDMHLEPTALVQALVLSLAASLLAGVYPSWKMSRELTTEALKSE